MLVFGDGFAVVGRREGVVDQVSIAGDGDPLGVEGERRVFGGWFVHVVPAFPVIS